MKKVKGGMVMIEISVKNGVRYERNRLTEAVW